MNMNKDLAIVTLSVTLAISIFIISQQGGLIDDKILEPDKDYVIPNWVKEVAGWWSQGLLTDAEYGATIDYLIEHNIIRIEK
jgi:hypothetical protein